MRNRSQFDNQLLQKCLQSRNNTTEFELMRIIQSRDPLLGLYTEGMYKSDHWRITTQEKLGTVSTGETNLQGQLLTKKTTHLKDGGEVEEDGVDAGALLKEHEAERDDEGLQVVPLQQLPLRHLLVGH